MFRSLQPPFARRMQYLDGIRVSWLAFSDTHIWVHFEIQWIRYPCGVPGPLQKVRRRDEDPLGKSGAKPGLTLISDIRAVVMHDDLFMEHPPQGKIEPEGDAGRVVEVKQVIIHGYGKKEGHLSQKTPGV